jgi:hypothetical protein
VAEQKKDNGTNDTSFLTYKDFLEEFKAEGDRASVILGAARPDLGLYHLLQHALLPNPTKSDDLLEGDNPLSTFSARINACYRLGLIDAELARSLHLIRKIRNVFAHETSGSSLNSGSHRDRVRELAQPFLKFEEYKQYRDQHFSLFEGASRDFRAVSAVIVIRLLGGLEYVPALNSEHCVSLIPPSYFEPDELEGENEENSAQKAKVDKSVEHPAGQPEPESNA